MLGQVLVSCLRIWFYIFIIPFAVSLVKPDISAVGIVSCRLLTVGTAMILEMLHLKKKYNIRFSNLSLKDYSRNILLYVLIGVGFYLFNNWIFRWDYINNYIVDLLSSNRHANAIVVDSPFLLVYGGIVAPVTEELYFRGALYNCLERKYGIGIACVITAFLWAVFHGPFYAFLYVFPMGVIMSLIYADRKNILIPITIHISNNVFAYSGQLGWYDGIMPYMVEVGVVMLIVAGSVYCWQRGRMGAE